MQLVLTSLDDDQAVETVSIPLAGKSSIADYMVVASGRSTRQVASMATKLAEKIKAEFGRSPRVEGLPDRRLGADRRGRRDRPPVPPRSAQLLQSRADVGVRRRRRRPSLTLKSRAMLLHIVARGRIGRGPEAELVERYLKRVDLADQDHRAARHRRQDARTGAGHPDRHARRDRRNLPSRVLAERLGAGAMTACARRAS